MPKARKTDPATGGPLSLVAVLAEPSFRFCFQKFCEQQHSEENLLFWVDVEEYQKLTDKKQLQTKAMEMAEVFFFI
jgi:hypothetical protein